VIKGLSFENGPCTGASACARKKGIGAVSVWQAGMARTMGVGLTQSQTHGGMMSMFGL